MTEVKSGRPVIFLMSHDKKELFKRAMNGSCSLKKIGHISNNERTLTKALDDLSFTCVCIIL